MKNKIAMAIFGAAMLPLALMAVQPDKFVRYVESTGSQYVDTGIIGRHGTKVECKVEWMEMGDVAFLASGDYAADKRFYMCYSASDAGHMFTAQGTGDKIKYNGKELCFVKKRIYKYVSDFAAPTDAGLSTNTVTIDGTKVFTVEKAATDSLKSLYVFACNGASGALAYSKTRCYGLKIWQDGELKRDFKPCVHGGRAGLYDAVSDQIFYSGSGTDLTYDKNHDVPDYFIEYVESAGNAYLDTGIIGRSGTAAKMEVEFKENYDNAILASRKGDSRFYLIHNGGSSKWLYGYGGYSTFGQLQLNKKYYVDSLLDVGSQVIKVGEDGPDGDASILLSKQDENEINTERSMYLFCCNDSRGRLDSKYWGKARIYWLQIFQDGEMVRDYRPCVKYGQAALYDDVSKTIFYPDEGAFLFDASVPADPEKLVFVDYIESDGFTYLDTGVSAQSPLRASGEFEWCKVRTKDQEQVIFAADYRSYLACGCYNSSSDANRFYMVTETSQKPWIGYGNNSSSFGSAYEAGKKYSFDVSFAAGSQTFALDSATIRAEQWAGEASGQGNLYLFACNDTKNKKPIYQSEARCYSLKIYQGENELVRDFKPCVKDGQAALYDTVSKRIFYPVPAIPAEGNTGAIKDESLLSPVETFAEYLESEGAQYVDTGIIARSGLALAFKETCMRPDANEYCFAGAIGEDTNSRFYLWYHGNINSLAVGYGSDYWRPSKSSPDKTAAKWEEGYEDCYRIFKGDTYHARVSFAAGSQTMHIYDDAAGTSKIVSRRNLSADVDTGRNLYLFARNKNGTADAFASSRLYWAKLYRDGKLARKFQPAILKNGLVCLWDHIEGKIYPLRNADGAITDRGIAGSPAKSIHAGVTAIIVR